MKRVAALLSTAAAWPVLAHEGHAATAHHWHATDVLGFVAAILVIAVALWRGGR